MATPKAAWGIEIGAFAIKAIRLERHGDEARVVDFAVIPHKKVLTTPDLDQDEMVRLGLGQFISQKSLEGEHLVMSVPGHSAFARFAKLPPVEPKKVPDIVKFEAVQQIPFPIDEVEWDYQTFTSPDTPEIEVGIFAITRERVQQRLSLYGELGVSPESLTLSPVAVFNAMTFDLADKIKGPVIYLDIGTSATDVIVADAGRCWIRTFPLGGTHFTEAIASAFKLSYSKAEKLKLEASDSKYAKQIMQAMRPVFTDLLHDLQRSIGYYQSTHREAQLTTMMGLGSTFRIPGLRKFLGQQLQIDVLRLDEFKRISVTGREAASFAENAVNMASAYGLALQGIGLAPIDANLVPIRTLREQMWHSKTKWFAAAAALVIVGSAMMLVRPLYDDSQMAAAEPGIVRTTIARGTELRNTFQNLRQTSDVGAAATNMLSLLDYRTIWPHLVNDAATALASAEPQPALLGNDPKAILAIAPRERKLLQLHTLTGDYVPPAQGAGRRISVKLEVELSHDRPEDFLNSTVASWLREHAEPSGERANVPYKILNVRINPHEMQTVHVTEEGEKTEVATPSTTTPFGGSTTPSSTPPPRTQDGGTIRGPIGPAAQAPGSGGSEGARTRNPDTTGTGAPPPPRPPRPSQWTPPPFGQPTPTPGSDPNRPQLDLDAEAPIPSKPRLFPPGSSYYRVPITFEIEVIDSKIQPGGEGAPDGAMQ